MKKTMTFACLSLLGMLFNQSLAASCCCSPNIVNIRTVPFEIDGTINPSNTTYCISQNLTYVGGEGMPESAITVDPGVHDIVIEFNGFELDVDPSVNGISMVGTPGQPIVDVIVRNGVIRSITPSGANSGILAGNINTVAIEHMRFVDTRRGFNALSQTAANINVNFDTCVFDLKGNTGTSRRGIVMGTVQGLQIQDCSFLANDPNETVAGGIGILLTNNARDAQIKRCTFDGLTKAGIIMQSLFGVPGFTFTFPSENILIDECKFTNIDSSDHLQNDCISLAGVSNIQVTNSSFYLPGNSLTAIVVESNGDETGTFSPIPSSVLIDSCTFTSESQGFSLSPFSFAQIFMGSVTSTGINTRDVIIQNSTFTHRGAPPQNDDIAFVGVEGAIIQNCVFDSTATGRLSGCVPVSILGVPTKSANIHLGGVVINGDEDRVRDGGYVTDVIIRDNEICGGSQVGIIAETSIGKTPNQRITIDHNSITASEQGILFVNTVSSVIKDNVVQGVDGSSCISPGVGIELDGAVSYNLQAASNSNALLNNTVDNNGIGILLKCGAQGNLVKENNVFNNSSRQIKEEAKKTNVFKDNTTFNYNNKVLNCTQDSSCSSSS